MVIRSLTLGVRLASTVQLRANGFTMVLPIIFQVLSCWLVVCRVPVKVSGAIKKSASTLPVTAQLQESSVASLSSNFPENFHPPSSIVLIDA